MPDSIKEQLSTTAATHYEARLFAETHPDYFVCQKNADAMLGYIQENKLDLTIDGFSKAYESLNSEGRLYTPSAESVAKMTAQEYEELAKLNGTPRRGADGKIVAYDWDPAWQRLPSAETENSPNRRRKSEMTHPEDFGAKPTKRELATWSAERFREWAESNGSWNRELPEYLR